MAGKIVPCDIYAPALRESTSHRGDQAVRDWDGFQPIVNRRNANLELADKAFGEKVLKGNARWRSAIMARLVKKKKNKAS